MAKPLIGMGLCDVDIRTSGRIGPLMKCVMVERMGTPIDQRMTKHSDFETSPDGQQVASAPLAVLPGFADVVACYRNDAVLPDEPLALGSEGEVLLLMPVVNPMRAAGELGG